MIMLSCLFSTCIIMTVLIITSTATSNKVKIVFKTLWNEIFVNVLENFILDFKLLNLVFLVLWFSNVLFFRIRVKLDLFEKVEEGWLFYLFCFLSTFFAFFLHCLHCDVLSLFPVNLISVTFFDFGFFNIEMFANFSVWKPLIFREVEIDWEFFQILSFFSLNLFKMLQ